MINTNNTFELAVFNRAAKIHRGWAKYTEEQEAFALQWLKMAAKQMAQNRNNVFYTYHDLYTSALEELGYYKLHKRGIECYGQKTLRTQR